MRPEHLQKDGHLPWATAARHRFNGEFLSAPTMCAQGHVLAQPLRPFI